MIRPQLFLLLLTCLFSSGNVFSQSYHATHGTPFAGSIGRFNNPASPVLGAYNWEVAPLGIQLSLASNNLYLDTTKIRVRPGLLNHYVHGNLDIGLMNFMVKVSPRMAISAGIRARTFNHYSTQPVNIVDTTTSLFSFLQDNRTTPNIGGNILHQGWLQGDLNLSRIMFSNSSGMLSAGVTLQIMKGLSGGYFNLRQVTYQEFINPPDTAYIFSGGGGRFGLSSVYDPANDIASFKDVVKQASTSLGLSIGAEYIHYTAEAAEEEDEEKKRLQYDWKLGVSLMDLGANRFQYAAYSRSWGDPIYPISDGTIENKLTSASSLSGLVDSISSLFTTINPSTGIFRVSLPTRLIINFDKKIYGGIYVNTNLSLNFFSDASPRKWRTNENNFLAITPRWEKRALGFFLPMQLTQQGHFWLGAAVKLGPLTLGLHSVELTKALAREPNLRGGGYLLFSIHPFGKKKVPNRLECWEN
jgi:hypothetical protein